MERFRISSVWLGAFYLICMTVLSRSEVDSMFPPPFTLASLCKFCDLQSSTCDGTGTCKSNCSITSICDHPEQVCVSIWRRNDNNHTLETLCHDPDVPLYGVRLDDSNSSTCVMKEKKAEGGMLSICSCNQEECNDNIIFTQLS